MIGYISNCLSSFSLPDSLFFSIPDSLFSLSPTLFFLFFFSLGRQPPAVARSLRWPPFSEEEGRFFATEHDLLPTEALSLSLSVADF